jgi:uncharacterized protein (DUF983 family)
MAAKYQLRNARASGRITVAGVCDPGRHFANPASQKPATTATDVDDPGPLVPRDRAAYDVAMAGNREQRSLSSGVGRMLLLVARALRLRCPACGVGKIFRGWFTMHDACSHCGRTFDRGPGYFLGSIYFNYGITAMLVVAMFFTFFFTEWLTGNQSLWALSAFALVFPLWFFRYARALWIAFDELWDPTSAPSATTDSVQKG